LIFSSNRYGLPAVTSTNFQGQPQTVQVSQLYMTGLVVDETTIRTYGAVYLWNQSQAHLNTTPAWEDFNIPIVVY
jgi:hypothetical protein